MLVDASVALKWFLDEDDSDRARRLIGSNELVALDLVLAETANALWKALRRGVIDQEVYRAALATLPTPFARIHSIEPLIEQAGSIAAEFDHPVYDCIYLAATLLLDETLVTADLRLIAKLANSRFAPNCISLADVGN